jgi:hypothetical protein
MGAFAIVLIPDLDIEPEENADETSARPTEID